MGDEPVKPTPRTLTEDEAYAIVADRVKRETADLTAANTTLTTENAELRSKLDLAEAGQATEKVGRETAEKALVDFKAEAETAAVVAARRGEREKKVREVAAHLKDDFYTDERRTRWAAMDDATFDAWCQDMAGSTALNPGSPPRDTAMKGAPVDPPADTGNAEKLFALSRGGDS